MIEMLMLGAGASFDGGVPSAYNMTKAIADQFRNDPQLQRYARVVTFVIGGLLFETGKSGQDPLTAGVNVEDLFNAVQLLAERHTLEAAPFVGSWHAMVDEFDRAPPSRSNTRSLGKIIYRLVSGEIRKALSNTPSSFEAGKIDGALTAAIKKTVEAAVKGRSPSLGSSDSVGKAVEHYVKATAEKWSTGLRSASPSSDSSLDREIEKLVDERRSRPGRGRIFHYTNELMTASLKSLVWIQAAKSVEHLGPLMNLLRRQGRLVIATLNYDNGVELLANSQRVDCETGIDRWSNTGNFDFAGDGLSLLKLHGSIDWVWHKNIRLPHRPMPHSIISRVSYKEMMEGQARPAVIFGQRNKLTAEGPFLDLLRTFREELSRSTSLTVVGYSFRDQHINVYISQWLNASQEHTIRIVNGANFVKKPVDYVNDLCLLPDAFPKQVEIIPHFARSGLLELYGRYDGLFEDRLSDEPKDNGSPDTAALQK